MAESSGLKSRLVSISQASKEPLLGGGDIVSNLPLQMTLYFNVCFFPCWLATCLYVLSIKFDSLPSHYKFVLITIYVVMSVVEAIRLYLGYRGNLQEKVPEMAGFWLLTLVIQTPLVLFLLINEGAVVLPLERAVHIPLLTFLLGEIGFGFWAIRIMTKSQTAKFHLLQFNELNPTIKKQN
ncbi:transmembrane protein 17B-like [Oscarella lobularis]|uniref:transmembrane protein 17B-like n=1 Tax=Oscarella lobularis TaxID=121494 RepID=UPI003313835F